MHHRQLLRNNSTLSNSTYYTAHSNTEHQASNPRYHSTPLPHSTLKRQESKHLAEDILQQNKTYPISFDQLIPLTGNKPNIRRNTTPLVKSTKTNNNNNNYICTGVPNEDPLPHYVLIPIGKTGDGKSSLLNSLFGYQEFKAAAAAKSVTDTVVERTGVWTVDRMNAIVTVADTPGFADSAGRDFTIAIQDYIMDVSNRIGIDAFLLVFQLKSQQVMSILKAFAELMKDVEPKNWWEHVILVFTRVDYTTEPQKLIQTKRYITQTLREEIKTTFGLENPPPAVFVSSKVHHCPLLSGKDCDCVEVKFYQNERMRILKEAIVTCGERGRWRATKVRQTVSDIVSQPLQNDDRNSHPNLYQSPPEPPIHQSQ